MLADGYVMITYYNKQTVDSRNNSESWKNSKEFRYQSWALDILDNDLIYNPMCYNVEQKKALKLQHDSSEIISSSAYAKLKILHARHLKFSLRLIFGCSYNLKLNKSGSSRFHVRPVFGYNIDVNRVSDIF